MSKKTKTTIQTRPPDVAGRYIIAEVEFDSAKRQSLPCAGYRPDIVIPSISDAYWGITFIEAEIECFDFPFMAKIVFTFNDEYYSKVAQNQIFHIMEGPHEVGRGKFLTIF
ncbi:hypothetical protein CHU32_19265 [Superficieibacter electus]|uniref:Uncharacterized protein n=1 Tax=Superficieibacter electus TaxID=2022662 RepID=A0A2P5GL85_9ENTR|nr:hypothetical protein [Superficieibacter electus]POP42706.1 hypothetical protein CHU33_18890 [Superficieibacter electus]POP45782.1 hypothetical protein CHU32_19265 [Superficieibacter electus]